MTKSHWNGTVILFLVVAILLIILFYLMFNWTENLHRGDECNADHHCADNLVCINNVCSYKLGQGKTAISLPCYSTTECPEGSYCSAVGYCLSGQAVLQGQTCNYNSQCQLGQYCDCQGHCSPGQLVLSQANINAYLFFESIKQARILIDYCYQEHEIFLRPLVTNENIVHYYDHDLKLMQVNEIKDCQVVASKYWTITDNILTLTDTKERADCVFLQQYNNSETEFCLTDIDGRRAYYHSTIKSKVKNNKIYFLSSAEVHDDSDLNLLILQNTKIAKL